MAKINFEEMAQRVAEKALDEIYEGKTIREWIEILAKQKPWEDCISRKAVLDVIQKLNIPEDMCVFEIKSHIEVKIAILPSVTPQQEPILDKIKAEIETEKNAGCHTQYAGGLDFALSVIDKYKAESEEQHE